MWRYIDAADEPLSYPVRVRGLKLECRQTAHRLSAGRDPVRVRGLKSVSVCHAGPPVQVVPRAGTWIEISDPGSTVATVTLYPVRVRGLKSSSSGDDEGSVVVVSRAGTWIEIKSGGGGYFDGFLLYPVRVRGLKYFVNQVPAAHKCRTRAGTWIEIPLMVIVRMSPSSYPVRVRGLKFRGLAFRGLVFMSYPVRVRGLK